MQAGDGRMTTWEKYSTNVFEVDIEEAATEVPQERSGMLALSSSPHFIEAIQRKKYQLGALKIHSYTFIHEGKKQKTTIFIKFNIRGDDELEECEFSFRTPIIQEGKFVQTPLSREFIQPGGDKELRQLASAVGGHVSMHVKNVSSYKHPADIAMERISSMLSADYEMMRERIRAAADAIRNSEIVRQRAWEDYYSNIRSQLQKSITAFPGISPDDLHRMIDEIVCSQMHTE